MTEPVLFPLSQAMNAKDMLAAAAQRDFTQVLILGTYPDGEVRHASTMTPERELWMLRLREMQLLGLIDSATVPT